MFENEKGQFYVQSFEKGSKTIKGLRRRTDNEQMHLKRYRPMMDNDNEIPMSVLGQEQHRACSDNAIPLMAN